MRPVALFALAVSACLAWGPLQAERIDAGMAAPPWEMEAGDGTEFSFPADVEGKASILFFWASWCPYCHAIMPYLQQIQEDYSEYGVRIYAINFHDDSDPVEYMSGLGWDFMVFPLGDLVADEYGVISSPGVLVVDSGGMVTYRRKRTRAPPGKAIAEVWDAQIREALDLALDRAPAGA
jgi:thiol-disulfide isomerase/thioredoxin